ncbi:hypothetical protein AM593_02853, partial [Mytilus galloprovincialis]
MQVQCTRVGSTSSTFFLITVDVQDINDNSPIFSGTPYYVSVNELTPIGTTIFRGIAAYDLDANTNKDIHFGIMPGDGVTQPTTGLHDATDKFQIATPRLGDITIKSTLDFEKVKKYVFRISATDQATNSSLRHTSTVTMTIDVSDGDDLGPVFYYNGCFQVDDTAQLILTGAENQSIINSIIARDQDTLNARIQLSIVETLPPGYKDKFTLINTTNTGTFSSVSVTQIEPLGSSDVNILKIIIKATELTDNRLFSRAVVNVHIYP